MCETTSTTVSDADWQLTVFGIVMGVWFGIAVAAVTFKYLPC